MASMGAGIGPGRFGHQSFQPRQQGLGFFTEVIVGGGGILVYSPIAGAGNLVTSVGQAAGTFDPFGNALLAGEADYFNSGTGYFAVSLDQGRVIFWASNTEAGPWNQQSQVAGFDFAVAPGATALQVTKSGTTANGSSFSVANNGGVREWYPPSGGDDFLPITTALLAGFDVDLTPGAFSISNTLGLNGAQQLLGSPGSVITPTANLPSGMVFIAGANNRVAGMQFAGGGKTADAIQVASGANRWTVNDITAVNVKGLVVDVPAITGANHGKIGGILATGCNGGIAVVNGGSGTAEISIAQVNIQSCQSAPVLVLNGVTDIGVTDLNGAVAGGSGVSAVQVIGNCQACWLDAIDVGGDSTAAAVPVLDIGSSGAPSEIAIANSVFQSGGIGVAVAGSAARIRFSSVMAKRNQGDGWLWSGSGAFNQMSHCAGNTNNQAAGTAYDLDVTSTAHLLATGFAPISGAVTAGVNITLVGNHVTLRDLPASATTAGNAPAGW